MYIRLFIFLSVIFSCTTICLDKESIDNCFSTNAFSKLSILNLDINSFSKYLFSLLVTEIFAIVIINMINNTAIPPNNIYFLSIFVILFFKTLSNLLIFQRRYLVKN